MKYFKFYLQKEGTDTSGNPYPVKESGEDFNVFEKECKFYGGAEVKDLPSRDWHDEDGDDEFIPSTLRYKSIECEVKFACKGDLFSSNSKIETFKEYLSSGTMKIYDEYNQVGRQNVRFVSIPDDATLYRKMDGTDEALVFTVKLKVNDPRTNITLSK